MNRRGLLASVVLLAWLSLSGNAYSECLPGMKRPGIWNQGVAPNARVQILFDSNVPNTGCMRSAILDGAQYWTGVEGVDVSGARGDATATVTVHAYPSPTSPHWDPTAWATTVNGAPPGGFNNGYVTNTEIYLQDPFIAVLQSECNAMRVVSSHEFGHVMGLLHTTPRVGFEPFSLMQPNMSLSEGINNLGYPNDCDKERTKEAKTFTGGSGDAGPDQACTYAGTPGTTDASGCCVPKLNFSITGYTNIKPFGHIVRPVHNSVLPLSSQGTLGIDVKDLDGAITRVEWYIRRADLGQPFALMYTAMSAPWTAPYFNPPAGVYELLAKVRDTAYEESWTTVKTITVGNFFALDTLEPGAMLWPGWAIVSSNSQYYLKFQTDGNLVLYTAAHQPIVWTGTFSATPDKVLMEPSGNATLRLWSSPTNSYVAWQTGTAGNAMSVLMVLNSGKVAVVRADGTYAWVYP